MSVIKGRHNVRRNESFARKSDSELRAIEKRGTLSSACALYHLNKRNASLYEGNNNNE